jgi:hypothetical protein
MFSETLEDAIGWYGLNISKLNNPSRPSNFIFFFLLLDHLNRMKVISFPCPDEGNAYEICKIRNLLGKKTFRQWNYSISCARAGPKLTESVGALNTLTNIFF